VCVATVTSDATIGAYDRWVRAQDAWLDPVLYVAVRDWLCDTWPFEHVDHAPRGEP